MKNYIIILGFALITTCTGYKLYEYNICGTYKDYEEEAFYSKNYEGKICGKFKKD